jgi:hypothetical protein
MKKLITALSLLIAAGLSLTPAVTAQAGVESTTFTFPVQIRLFVPCANGGAGEFVALTGETTVLLHSAGNLHNSLTLRHAQTHLTGVGEITGDVYRFSGMRTDTVEGGPASIELNMNSFRLIGQGPDNNFTFHQIVYFHFTPTEKTITIGNSYVKCQ